MRQAGLAQVPVIVGGIVPAEDEKILLASGVARVFTPKDYDLTAVMAEIVDIVERGAPAA
jgi:(2R)-ethylmalonyl-CoA mutase